MPLNTCRLENFVDFGSKLAKEHKAKVSKISKACKKTGNRRRILKKYMMRRRRCEAAWLLDYTSIKAMVEIVDKFRNDGPKLLFMLVALVTGFCSWRNVEVAGGVSYLERLWSGKISWENAGKRRQETSSRKKPYDVDRSMASHHPSGCALNGCLMFLRRYQTSMAKEV